MKKKIECKWGYRSLFSRMVIGYFAKKYNWKAPGQTIDQCVDGWFEGFKNSAYEGDVMTASRKIHFWFEEFFADCGYTRENVEKRANAIMREIYPDNEISIDYDGVLEAIRAFDEDFSWLADYAYEGKYHQGIICVLEDMINSCRFDTRENPAPEGFLDYVKDFVIKYAVENSGHHGKTSNSLIHSVEDLNILVRNTDHGTNAQKKYVECCEKFGWDISKKSKFAIMQPLYAEKATPEGYNVWFLAHSNLTNTKGGTWLNTIEGNFIFEEWLAPRDDIWNDKNMRIVFAKEGSRYIFKGVYKPDGIEKQENGHYIKTYRLVRHFYWQE